MILFYLNLSRFSRLILCIYQYLFVKNILNHSIIMSVFWVNTLCSSLQIKYFNSHQQNHVQDSIDLPLQLKFYFKSFIMLIYRSYYCIFCLISYVLFTFWHGKRTHTPSKFEKMTSKILFKKVTPWFFLSWCPLNIVIK